jgi:hypothetical protein
MAYNFTSDDLVPLAGSVARRIEVHATTVCIHDVSVDRSAIAEYLQAIDAAKQEIALIHALEVGVTEILVRRHAKM